MLSLLSGTRPFGLLNAEINQNRPREIQKGEKIEVRGETKRFAHSCRNQATDQIASYIAGDVGGEGAACVGHAALLAEIGERQREGGGHAKALQYA